MRLTATADREAFVQAGMAAYADDINERMRDVSDAWPDCVEAIFEHESEVFRNEGETAEHAPWAPLSDSYAAWKARVAPGKPILQLTSRLRRQLTGESGDHYERREPTRLTIGSDYIISGGADLGGIHAVGRQLPPPMPARPPFRVTQGLSDTLGLTIADHVLDAPEE